MIVDDPDFLNESLSPRQALRKVYQRYGFKVPSEIDENTYIVNVEINGLDPRVITQRNYYDNVLDPIGHQAKGMTLIDFKCVDKKLIFVFGIESCLS